MKKLLLLGLLCGVLLVGGCGGVWMNAEYSMLLDQTAALSEATATRAATGLMPESAMIDALDAQTQAWKNFQDARDGIGGDE